MIQVPSMTTRLLIDQTQVCLKISAFNHRKTRNNFSEGTLNILTKKR